MRSDKLGGRYIMERIEGFEDEARAMADAAWAAKTEPTKIDGGGLRFNEGKTPFKYIPLHLLAGAARVLHKATTREQNPYEMWPGALILVSHMNAC